MGGDEFVGGHGLHEVWDEEGSECDVEREEGFYAVSHVKGGIASGLANSSSVGPEDMRDHCWPLRDVAFISLRERLPNGSMLPFNDPVSPQVVCRNPNMSDAVLACQPV